MKVKCLKCGFTYDIEGTGGEMCPECGCRHWSMRFNEPEMGLSDDSFKYRKDKKEEGLAFEIFDIKDGNKIRNRKIYFNGHIEGFKGDPCIVNHAYPKLMQLRGVIIDTLRQMNNDYRNLIAKHSLADLPIDPVELANFYKAQLERINNIKI